ncbi:MAG: hypothetical protein EHM93_10140 [Bacteroidales bacterium]|nr:MAG: hypothetical protein EHM93_10140 [Bacteroidales bacterium]
MKKKNVFVAVFMPVVLTLSMLLVFSEKIASKPSSAGFWFIFVFGASIGIALTRIIQMYKEKKSV